jgi:hypothetical protein
MVAGMPESPDQLTVYKFQPGMTIRILKSFEDYDGQKIEAGEVLHLLETNYLPYESGRTLTFAEKTIRLSGDVGEEWVIIANVDNAWYELVT